MLYPLLFETSLFPIVWGGTRLRQMKGMAPSCEPVGESWEVSAVPGKESVVLNGGLVGKNLRELCQQYGSDLLGGAVHQKFNGEFPMLIKFIDAVEVSVLVLECAVISFSYGNDFDCIVCKN